MRFIIDVILIMSVSLFLYNCGKSSSSINELTEDYIFVIKASGYKYSDFKNFLELHGLVEASQADNRDKLLSSMLDVFIDQKLLEKEVEKAKLDIDNKEKQSFINDNLMEKDAISSEDKRLIAKELIIQKYLLMKLVSGIDVSDDEIKNYYEQNKDKFFMRERIMIVQLLLEDEQIADDIYNKLTKKSSLLKEAISKKSVEDIKLKGVIVATYQKGELPQHIEDYLWKLPVRGINKPYISDDGEIMMFVVLDKKAEGLASLEEVKHKIMKKLALIKIEAMAQQLLDKLAKESEIKIFQKNLDFIYSGKYIGALI